MPNYQGPGVYRHYKGGVYEVIGLAVREETLLKDGGREYDTDGVPKTREGVTVVVYRPLSEGSILEDRSETMWTRELRDFNDERVHDGEEWTTTGPSFPMARFVPRFAKIQDPKGGLSVELRVEARDAIRELLRTQSRFASTPHHRPTRDAFAAASDRAYRLIKTLEALDA